VTTLGEAMSIEPILDCLPEQAGDVPRTYADITKATRLLGYRPATLFQEGIKKFVSWLLLPAAQSASLASSAR
jgi:UDP-glucuronate 4-epimerase